VLGFLRRLLHASGILAGMQGALLSGVALLALAVIAAGCACDEEKPAGSTATSPDSAETTARPLAVDNPTLVGRAVDAIARPAITGVLGEPVLTRASDEETFIVNLTYQAPAAAAEGDGDRLRDEFVSRGATIAAGQADMDYHSGEEFIVEYDTGDPAFKTIRVLITPGSNDVYVNADRSE